MGRWGAGRFSKGRARGASADRSADGLMLRESGRWSSMPLSGRDPLQVDLDHVLRFAEPRARRATSDAVVGDPVLQPVLPLVLGVRNGRLGLVPPSSDDWALLDEDHVRLLDLLDRPMAFGEATRKLGWHEHRVLSTAARLQELGAVHLRPEGTWIDFAPLMEPTAEPAAKTAPRNMAHAALAPLDPDRIPVISVHQPRFGPPLALGMILAHARVWEGGRLNEAYELRPAITHDEARQLLSGHRGPAVLLCSNYLWSYEENLELAAELAATMPQLVAVHGGPHTPKYEEDEQRFFEQPGVHVAVRGEGEMTAVELLDRLAQAERFADLDVLAQVDGLTYRSNATGELVRTAERERIADLDTLPSPYLTGEFDDLHPGTWDEDLGIVCVFETNRGCPYKCSFCDWGSATMSRIRKFDMDRISAEMRWLADRGQAVWMVSDANFGILPRDTEITDRLIELHRETGLPGFWGVNTAKNATKNLSRIISSLCDEGIAVVSSLALQSRDPAVLEAIDRSNISTEKYDDLAVTFRRQRLPILCDLIVGLPGATVESFKDDLQWCVDHEITPRAWVCQVLPNAPMNDPEYKARYRLVVDDEDVVIASSSFSEDDRRRMMDLRMAQRVFEHLGLLRHVLRHLQWDLDMASMDVIDRIIDITQRDPDRYPLVAWTLRYMDLVLMPPAGWAPFYAEVRSLLHDELGVPLTPELDTVLDVQTAIMPDRGRDYPCVVPLAHDYVAYYRDATRSLQVDGTATGPERPLASYPPGTLEVRGDPGSVALEFGRFENGRDPDLLPGKFWQISHFELDSPLTRWVAEVRATPGYSFEPLEPLPDEPERRADDLVTQPVTLRPSPPRT